jgi:hypothetical protein
LYTIELELSPSWREVLWAPPTTSKPREEQYTAPVLGSFDNREILDNLKVNSPKSTPSSAGRCGLTPQKRLHRPQQNLEKATRSLGRWKQRFLSRAFLSVLLIFAAVSGAIAVYFLYPFVPGSFPQAREGGAAIVDPLSESDPDPSFAQSAVEYFTAAGMYVDIYNASTVSVQFMKSFPVGYELILFRVHSGTGTHGVFYFTSEQYDETRYQPEQYRDELEPAQDYEGHPQVFAFGAKFVDTYMQKRFQDSIIVGMGCFGVGTSYSTEDVPAQQADSNIADAFIRQGALAVIGWDRLVSLGFSDHASLRLIKALTVEHMSVSEAVEVTNRESGPDPTYQSRLAFYPEDGGDKFLLCQSQSFVLAPLIASATYPLETTRDLEER